MATTMQSNAELKDTIELEFRSIRVGTLRTFPIKKLGVETNEPAVLNEKGIQFIIQLNADGDAKEIVIKISARRILSVQAHMQRGCSVLWMTPDGVCSERIRTRCEITNRKGPYLDPDSEAVTEHQIAIILSQDPLPFLVSYNMKRIFHKIALRNGVDVDSFFTNISWRECNDKLLKCTVHMENVEKFMLDAATPRCSIVSDLKKKSTFLKKSGSNKKVVEFETDDFSDDEQEENELLIDDGIDNLSGTTSSMAARIRELQEQQLCKICMTRLANVVFVPCGHLCSCMNCAIVLGKCPLCRKKIEKAIRTYMS